MSHISTNYNWAKMTSGVFMLVVVGHLSKTNYVNCFIVNNGHIYI